ncbi:F-box domain-containing protein [Mycena venus]|uniref:F-box domain-containing protein n=1 Tax=Mycena venus TaxID=2733690 RepID=A0A8H7D9K8_9AGAR|nr:F-box domain-containing protein [Mycena venus]
MSCATELRARIDELSSAIEFLGLVLSDLETRRTNARRELNSILDPVARLPLEISSDIFLRCMSTASSHPRPNPSAAPMIFLNICRSWTDIALATPWLWAAIDIDAPPYGARFAELCKLWASRARTLPLSFKLTVHKPLDRHIQDFLKQNTSRLQNFELYVDTADDLRRIRIGGPFSSLKTLTIGVSGNLAETDFVNANECVEILRAAPELMECHFVNLYYEEDIWSWELSEAALTLTSLQHLHLGNPHVHISDGVQSNSAYILQNLTLPGLKSLHISDLDIDSEDFTSFLTRSSPPLESVSMVMPTVHSSRYIGTENFRFIPSLTDLELLCLPESPEDRNPFPAVFEMLSAEDFLPNLSNLTIFSIGAYFSQATHYEKLSVALAQRASSLRSFRLIFPFNEEIQDIAPPADVILALQQLVKEGMHIHVGPEDRNWFWILLFISDINTGNS